MEPDGRPSGLSAGRALAIFLAYFGAQLVAGILVGIVFVGYAISRRGVDPHIAMDAQRLLILPAALLGLMAGGLVAFWMVRRSLPGPLPSALRAIGWCKASSRDVLVSALAGAGLAAVYLFVLTPHSASPPVEQWGPLATAASAGGWARHAWALLALLAPPVEEFVFRGVLLAGLSRSWSTPSAAAVVTALFVAAHFGEVLVYAPAFVAIILAGIATVVARVVTRSLVPAMVLHGCYNLGLVLAVYAGASGAAASERTQAAAPAEQAVIAERDAAIEQVKRIVNEPVAPLPRDPEALVSRYSPGWFHEGAQRPDYSADVRATQELPYERHQYVTSDLNPGLMFRGRDLEFNPMLKYFYTDRSLPKKRLGEAEMAEINRLYRIIGAREADLARLRGQGVPGAPVAEEAPNRGPLYAAAAVLVALLAVLLYRRRAAS
jgi:membrane protease YdiL (CAAX protease family)